MIVRKRALKTITILIIITQTLIIYNSFSLAKLYNNHQNKTIYKLM